MHVSYNVVYKRKFPQNFKAIRKHEVYVINLIQALGRERWRKRERARESTYYIEGAKEIWEFFVKRYMCVVRKGQKKRREKEIK